MKCKHHKYQKKILGKDYLVYKCVNPGCSHYISSELVVGKIAVCFRCDNKFVVTQDQVRKGKEMLKLHCKPCTKSKKKKNVEIKAEDILSHFNIKI